MTIVEFLRARLDEIERVAQRASSYGPVWRGSDSGIYPSDESMHPGAIAVGPYDHLYDEYAEHIALHDPARVLREVEAHRRIVDLYERVEHDSWGTEDNREPFIGKQYLRDVLPLLALPYADHPDYDPSWSPT